MRILTDEAVQRLPAAVAIEAVRQVLAARARGRLVAPPRFGSDHPSGQLVFTVGGIGDALVGFRAYDTFGLDNDQVVAVWRERRLAGLVIGVQLGIRRTSAIGAVAADVLARGDASVFGLVGPGRQGLAHLRAVAAVRDLREVRLYQRRPRAREAAARWVEQELGIEAEACSSAEEAAAGADLVTLATPSGEPVVDPAAIAPGTHVATLGPKRRAAHELPVEVAARAGVIACDSPEQFAALRPTFLDGTPAAERVVDLAALAAGERPSRRSRDEVTLFCSVGLAGTEPAVAAALLDWVERGERASGEAEA